jgi:predicted transcriptional regulator
MGTAVRYSKDLRRRAARFARRRRRLGTPVAAIARELGLRARTLRLWLQEPASPPRLRRVAVATEPENSGSARGVSVLVTSQGIRVEGLDLQAVVTLLRGLR